MFRDYTFPSCNGRTDIYVRSFVPEGKKRGIVQLAHGVAEHIARYDDFAQYLCESGFVVAGNDHLGHGKSIVTPDDLGYFADEGGWELVVGDMHQLHEQLTAQFPGLPYFLFGHSMGSFLTRTYIIRYRTGLTGAIICGTGQQASPLIKAGKLAAAYEVRRHGPRYKSERLNTMAFGQYNAAFAPQRTASDWLSRDEAVVDRYNEDPLCGYIPSASLFRDMMGALEYIGAERNLKRMKKDLPIFFISGDKDPVGESGKGVLRAYTKFLHAGMTDVTLKLYHNDRHEILNELDHQTVYDDISNWLFTKLPDLA